MQNDAIVVKQPMKGLLYQLISQQHSCGHQCHIQLAEIRPQDQIAIVKTPGKHCQNKNDSITNKVSVVNALLISFGAFALPVTRSGG